MNDVLSQTTWAATLLLVAARVGGIFIVAPVFSTSALPVKLRAGMALVFAVGLLASVTPAPVPADRPLPPELFNVDVITPNIVEACQLTGRQIGSADHLCG